MAKITDKDIEEGVDELMEIVVEHELASPDVPRSVTVDFFERVVERLRERITTIKGEMDDDEDDEEIEDDDG